MCSCLSVLYSLIHNLYEQGEEVKMVGTAGVGINYNSSGGMHCYINTSANII